MPLLSLALPPRALEGGCLCHIVGHLGCRHCCHSGGGGGVERKQVPGYLSHIRVSQTCGGHQRGKGDHSWECCHDWIEKGHRPHSHVPWNPTVTGITVACRSQSRLLLFLLLWGSSGLQAQLPQPRGWDCGHHLHSLRSYLSISSSSPTFRCTDVWISWVPCCVGHRKFCWVTDILKMENNLYRTILYRNMECWVYESR